MYMLFAVRWQHDQQPSGRAALPWILHCHHIAASYFTILTISTFVTVFPTTIVVSTFVNMYTFKVNFIVFITWFVYFWDRVPGLRAVCFLVGLSEHLLYVDGELRPHYLGEGQQGARYVHSVIDVSVPQL